MTARCASGSVPEVHKAPVFALAAAAPLLLLAACSGRPRFVFFLDPFQREVWEQAGLDEAELGGIAAGRFNVEVQVYPPQEVEQVRRSLTQRPPAAAYLSPLFALPVSELARALPRTTLVVEAPSESPNTITISFDREQAYSRAGAEIGALLADQRASPLFRSFLAVGEPARCAVVLAAPGARARSEAAAFRRGFDSTAARGLLETRELPDLADKSRARQVVERLRDAGTVVFVLKTYALTGFCLDVLRERGGWAVVEDWWETGAYRDVLLLSIQDDWRQAFRSVFQRLAPQPSRLKVQSTAAVHAPVLLRWGIRARALLPTLAEPPQK